MYDVTAGQVLFEEYAHEKRAPASLTKLVTALVALKYSTPETVFTVGRELEFVQAGSSLALIQQRQRLTLEQLLYGLLLPSGNDASYTIATNVGRIIQPNAQTHQAAVSAFVGAMNAYCAAIGMTESHFANPDGWDDPDQYTTAHDLRLLAEAALADPLIQTIVRTENKLVVFASGEQITWHNSNKLLNPKSGFYQPTCIGIKTGTTDSAGECLVSAFDRTDRFIVVVLNCESDEARYRYTAELLQAYGS